MQWLTTLGLDRTTHMYSTQCVLLEFLWSGQWQLELRHTEQPSHAYTHMYMDHPRMYVVQEWSSVHVHTHLPIAEESEDSPWNFKLLYVTVSTLKPIAVWTGKDSKQLTIHVMPCPVRLHMCMHNWAFKKRHNQFYSSAYDWRLHDWTDRQHTYVRMYVHTYTPQYTYVRTYAIGSISVWLFHRADPVRCKISHPFVSHLFTCDVSMHYITQLKGQWTSGSASRPHTTDTGVSTTLLGWISSSLHLCHLTTQHLRPIHNTYVCMYVCTNCKERT